MSKTSQFLSKASYSKVLFKNPIVILSIIISIVSLVCAGIFWWKWQVAINQPGKFDRPLTIEEQRQIIVGLRSSTSPLIADKKTYQTLSSLSSTSTSKDMDQNQQLELLKKLKR